MQLKPRTMHFSKPNTFHLSRCACADKPSKEAGGASEQQYVHNVIDLHDKFLQVHAAAISAAAAVIA